jgi:midasin
MIINQNNNEESMKPILALVHGACLIFIDSMSVEQQNSPTDLNPRQICMQFIFEKIKYHLNFDAHEMFISNLNQISNTDHELKCGPFSLKKGDFRPNVINNETYCFESKTTLANLQRIMRCMMMHAPIMLEGSPGVGKTSLVEALGKITNNKVVRINLSEQTDLNELFGADLPCESTQQDVKNKFQQRFDWHDGPFLMALKQGYWIILDEINLASQSVLEGLNSCFDHRNEVYISELNKRFYINKEKTKIFACQNPFNQGGGRKGLPKSFLNRFSKVYIDQMTHDDLLFIISNVYSSKIDTTDIRKMIEFNDIINQQVFFNLNKLLCLVFKLSKSFVFIILDYCVNAFVKFCLKYTG